MEIFRKTDTYDHFEIINDKIVCCNTSLFYKVLTADDICEKLNHLVNVENYLENKEKEKLV